MNNTFGPYTPVRQAGNLYFVSGQVGFDTQTKQAPKDITAQTEQALTNLGDVLATVGLDPSDVVKTTVYLCDMGDFAAMNTAYEAFFASPRPARAAVAVNELPRVAGDTAILVEIEAVAYKEAA